LWENIEKSLSGKKMGSALSVSSQISWNVVEGSGGKM